MTNDKHALLLTPLGHIQEAIDSLPQPAALRSAASPVVGETTTEYSEWAGLFPHAPELLESEAAAMLARHRQAVDEQYGKGTNGPSRNATQAESDRGALLAEVARLRRLAATQHPTPSVAAAVHAEEAHRKEYMNCSLCGKYKGCWTDSGVCSDCDEAEDERKMAENDEGEGNIELVGTDALADLVNRFSIALLAKLQAAKVKYGYAADDFLSNDWEKECREGLYGHIQKGDPRDVAAYCAFMWHHGWSTATPSVTLVEGEAQQVSPWKPLAEGMPASKQEVVLMDATGDYLPAVAALQPNGKWKQGWSAWPLDAFTHYMPLPAAPLPQKAQPDPTLSAIEASGLERYHELQRCGGCEWCEGPQKAQEAGKEATGE